MEERRVDSTGKKNRMDRERQRRKKVGEEQKK